MRPPRESYQRNPGIQIQAFPDTRYTDQWPNIRDPYKTSFSSFDHGLCTGLSIETKVSSPPILRRINVQPPLGRRRLELIKQWPCLRPCALSSGDMYFEPLYISFKVTMRLQEDLVAVNACDIWYGLVKAVAQSSVQSHRNIFNSLLLFCLLSLLCRFHVFIREIRLRFRCLCWL